MDSPAKIAFLPELKYAASFVFAVILSVTSFGVAAAAETPLNTDAGMSPAQFADAARLAVMIEATVDGTPSQGAGVIFAVNGNKAYILTANHVVRSTAAARNVRVFFSTNQSASVPATVLPQFSSDLDLAVLEVDVTAVDLQSEKQLPFELLDGDSSKLQRSSPLYPIGYPEGYKWQSPLLAPDLFERPDRQRFYFQTHDVKVGYSGGPVCSADWHIVGIVLAGVQAPDVMALPIETAKQQIKEWGFAIGVAKSETPPTTAVTASSAPKTDKVTSPAPGDGVKEGKTINGVVFRSLSPWGGFSNDDPTWIQLVAQKIEGIPPQKTWFGNTADYLLVLSNSSGKTTSVALNDANHAIFKPAREEDLDGALIRLTARSSFSTWDVTFPAAITFPKVRQSQKLVLRYVDKVIEEVHDRNDRTDVTMFAQARQFLPDGNSGVAADPTTAGVVAFGTPTENSVSFDDSLATRHMILNPSGGSCTGILWIESTGDVGLTSTQRQVDLGSLSLLLEGPAAKAKLYLVHCDGKRTILRVQAESPGSSAKYNIFVHSDSSQAVPQLETPLVQGWIDAWVNTKKKTFDFEKVTPPQWDAIDAGLEKIRQYTSSSPDAFIISLSNSLAKGTGETFDGIRVGYWGFLESIVSRHRDEISSALQHCCSDAVQVRFITNLLLAEAQLSYDETALKWAKTDSSLPETLQTRVKRFIPWNPATH